MEYIPALRSEIDELKPSIFELLSEQQLSALLPPSLRYLLVVLAQRRPRYFLRILNNFDELYALLSFFAERHFLKTYGGGFTENFYGLKRERVLRIQGGEVVRAGLGASSIVRQKLRLTDSDIWKNLAVMIGIPYLKRKLEEGYQIHVPQVNILGPRYNRDRLPQILQSDNACYITITFSLAYLSNSSKYPSPFLWLIGTRLRRLSADDHGAIAMAMKAAGNPARRPGQPPLTTRSLLDPMFLRTIVYPRFLSSLQVLLPTSIFLLKFLEWWHASDFARQLSKKASEGIELPPPLVAGVTVGRLGKEQHPVSAAESQNPEKEDAESAPSTNHRSELDIKRHKAPVSSLTKLPVYTLALPQDASLCPICLWPIQTPTACQTGHVFCYTCIFKWISGTNERQERFMEGLEKPFGGSGEDLTRSEDGKHDSEGPKQAKQEGKEVAESRVGKWENGKGRCAITGRRVLGGTDGLRRVMV